MRVTSSSPTSDGLVSSSARLIGGSAALPSSTAPPSTGASPGTITGTDGVGVGMLGSPAALFMRFEAEALGARDGGGMSGIDRGRSSTFSS